MTELLTRCEALRALLALRSGATSALAARVTTVGTADIQAKLVESIYDAATDTAIDRCVLVSADWGFGKSHLKTLLTAELFRDRIPFICDSIDGRASSLSHLHRVMPHWLEGIQIGSHAGLREAFIQSELSVPRAITWAATRPDPFARGLHSALCGASAGWLLALGHRYRTPDHSYQHPKALALLNGSAKLLADQGRGGIVLMLDEIENVDKQYNICGRRNSYATLARLVRHPNIVPVMFVTPRFFSQVEDDLRHGTRQAWYGWYPEAKAFVQELSTKEVLTPPVFNRQLADQLVGNVVTMFCIAYGCRPDRFITDGILNAWWRSSTRSIRYLVRLTVNELDIQLQKMAASSTIQFSARSKHHSGQTSAARATINSAPETAAV